MAERPRGPSKNPSTTFFWNDWDNDEALKACSLAAQGLWMRCLCIAARSPEPGVVMIGGFPASRAEITPRIAAVVGASLDEVNALIGELLTSGTASLDRKGRIINRRMVKAAALHRKRSEAGKAGAAASARSRTPLSQAEAPQNVENGGRNDNGLTDWDNYEIEGLPQQNDGKPPGKEPANPPANGSPSSRLQDFSSSESPTATEISSVASGPESARGLPPFLRRKPSRVAELVPPDFEPEPSTREALEAARPDIDAETMERRRIAFRNWCAEKAITSHNFEATWYSFMVKTHVQSSAQTNGRAQGGEPSVDDGIAAAFARRSVPAGG